MGSDEADQLVTDYQAGTKVKDLAARYGINRNTVIGHINRAGVRRHYPALQGAELEVARHLYESGQSASVVAGHFGIDTSTVWRTLHRAGVKMRDSQGRER